MFFLRLIRFLFGYVRISVSGRFPERFLNICAKHGVPVWYSRRRGESIECCLFARDYRKLLRLRRGCGVSVRIRRKCGVPFFFHRYRRRKGLVCGAAIFCVFLAVMPRFVWSVQVNADGGIRDEQVLQALEDIGVYVGVPKSQVDPGNMRVQLAMALPQIAWASLNTDGTVVTVEVRTATEKEARDDAYSNLVADCDGRVTAVYVRSGSAAVQAGDAVVKGQLLVSGTEAYKDGSTVFRHSDADILAETRHKLTVSVPLKQTVSVDTGRVCRRCVVSVFGLEIPLYLGQIDFPYRSRSETAPLVIGGVTLPVWTAAADFYEVSEREITLTAEQAKQRADQLLEEEKSAKLAGKELLSCEVEYEERDGALIASAHCLCSENIARTEYFELGNE